MIEIDSEAVFKEVTDQIFAEEINRVLDRNIVRVQNWAHNQRMDGLTPSLYDLTKKLSRDKIETKVLVAALSAALWRLSGESEVQSGG